MKWNSLDVQEEYDMLLSEYQDEMSLKPQELDAHHERADLLPMLNTWNKKRN